MAVGRWASVPVLVGCEWKVKANLNTRETRSARIHASIIPRPYPQCCGVVYVTQRVWAPFLTSTSIFTTLLFSVFTIRLVSIKSLWFSPLSMLTVLFSSPIVNVVVLCLLHVLFWVFFLVIAFSCVTYFVKAYLWILHGPCSFKFLFLACCNGGHCSIGRRVLVHYSLGASDINFRQMRPLCQHCVSSSSFPG